MGPNMDPKDPTTGPTWTQKDPRLIPIIPKWTQKKRLGPKDLKGPICDPNEPQSVGGTNIDRRFAYASLNKKQMRRNLM